MDMHNVSPFRAPSGRPRTAEPEMADQLNSIDEIVDELRAGRMVIMMDDEDRENEGDLIVAAEKITPQIINFMATHARGLICLTLTKARCNQLQLPLMVRDNGAHHGTNFTLSIEAAVGVTTGISAADRAETIRAAVRRNAVPSDLVQPGHIFPLMARDGGVLTRAGHTEAGCDLAEMAGFESAAVIVEILNEDGTMARMPQLLEFARKHNIKIGTVADLIRHRLESEKTVRRVSSFPLPTEFGEFMLYGYQDVVSQEIHFALVKGQIQAEDPVLVRVHVHDALSDVFGCQRGDAFGWPLRDVLQRLAQEKSAVAVVLREHEEPDTFLERVKANRSRSEATGEPPKDLRTVGIGAQILRDIGVRRMRVLGSPKKLHALNGFDLEVVDYVARH